MARISHFQVPLIFILMAGTAGLSTGAPGKGRRNRPPQPAAPAPAVVEEKKEEDLSPWRTWSDSAGRTVDAEFRGLDGDKLSVRTKEGKVYVLTLSKLVEIDQAAAREMQSRMPVPKPVVNVALSAAKLDELVLAGLSKAGLKANAPVSEELFVRRLYLDVAGRIPTTQESSAYLNDKGADKRSRLIDHVLASEGYNSHMFNWLADMLRVEDDYGKGAKAYVYEEWIKEQIDKNRPWDGLVHDLLAADGRLTTSGPVGYLLRDRNMPLDSLSNTLTTFLGANVACAQCHDHPLAPWKQRDFYQMASFFGATDTSDGKAKQQAKRLSARTEFDKGYLLRLIAPNAAEVEDLHRNTMTFPKDYKYSDAKPGEAVAPRFIQWGEADANNPAYAVDMSRPETLRDGFAKWLTHEQNPRFATAIANRLWKRFFGLAVQEPVTDLDDLSKGVNPELLAQLTVDMKAVGFDLREFQRIILNTQAYQREAGLTPDLAKGGYLFPGPLLRRMTAEQAWDSVLTLVVGPQLDQFKLSRANEVRRLDIPGKVLTPESILAKARELKAESPVGQRKKKGAGGKGGGGTEVNPDDYEGTPPPRFEGMTLARASELPQPAKEAHFLRMFGQSDRTLADGSTQEGGVPQVLMLMNGEVQKVIASDASHVLKDAASQKTQEHQIESLYSSFLGRRPSISESITARKALNEGLKLGDLTWVLFNSREFIFIQ